MAVAEALLADGSGEIDVFSDPRINVILSRSDGLVEAYINVNLLDSCGCPVDQDNVDKLIRQFRDKERAVPGGQESPILVAQIPGYNLLPIKDGLHRNQVVKYLSNEDLQAGRPPRPAWCAVELGANWDDVIDDQIIQTRKHKTIGPPRWAKLVDRSWKLHPLSDQMYSFEVFDPRFLNDSADMAEMGLDISDDDEVQARTWARMKLERWGLKPKQFQKFLSAAVVSDSDLADLVRVRDSQGKFSDLPAGHFIAIADELPGLEHLHQMIARQVIKEQLSIGETRNLARALDGVSADEAVRIIDSRSWKSSPVKLATERNGYKPDDRDVAIVRLGRQVREQEDEIIRLTKALEDVESSDQSRQITGLKGQISELEQQVSNFDVERAGYLSQIELLQGRVVELEGAVNSPESPNATGGLDGIDTALLEAEIETGEEADLEIDMDDPEIGQNGRSKRGRTTRTLD